MQPVHSWQDLKQFGIDCLTGEACAYSMRVLCDVNDEGKALLCDYLALPSDTKLLPSWNTTFTAGSIMLERHCLYHLAQFAFLRSGAKAVYITDTSVQDATEYLAQYEAAADLPGRLVRNTSTTSRNTHAATGRTA